MTSRVPSLFFGLARRACPRTLRASQLQNPSLSLSRSSRGFAISLPRPAHAIPRPPDHSSIRLKPEDEAEAISPGEEPKSQGERPTLPDTSSTRDLAYYQLSFTCVPCGHRSHHNISKQGYHKGSILITCPECRNRHIISDHLGIFGDRDITVEDLMREKGRLVKRGSLGEDGDVEFWADEAPEGESQGSRGTSGS
ncbi:hypothetical protein HIM_02386 [Hirsutella minnesotensis 3608]|nr:hypothetical protein HIM_02386 [Hirsutella minnesotensis 3608]